MLCENPIAEASEDRRFILHNRTPTLLAEVHHYEDLTNSDSLKIQSQIPVGGRLDYGLETIFFTPVWLDETDLAGTAQEQADKLAGLFRRMADWYKSYLIWEDDQDGED